MCRVSNDPLLAHGFPGHQFNIFLLGTLIMYGNYSSSPHRVGVGNLKGVGRIYQQTFIDTYAKVSFAKLYDRKTLITAADLMNDRVLPFFEEHEVKLLRVLTDRGSEFCGNPERHEYELYLAVEDIDHSAPRPRAGRPTASA